MGRRYREAVLVAENAGFDAHLQHHHTIILGDMNYRVCQPPRLILEMVAWAAIQVSHTHPPTLRYDTDRAGWLADQHGDGV